jgi:hypothetical protein
MAARRKKVGVQITVLDQKSPRGRRPFLEQTLPAFGGLALIGDRHQVKQRE